MGLIIQEICNNTLGGLAVRKASGSWDNEYPSAVRAGSTGKVAYTLTESCFDKRYDW